MSGRSIPIESERCWYLSVTPDFETECIDIEEWHDDGENKEGFRPHIVVPVESISELIEELQSFKKRIEERQS